MKARHAARRTRRVIEAACGRDARPRPRRRGRRRPLPGPAQLGRAPPPTSPACATWPRPSAKAAELAANPALQRDSRSARSGSGTTRRFLHAGAGHPRRRRPRRASRGRSPQVGRPLLKIHELRKTGEVGADRRRAPLRPAHAQHHQRADRLLPAADVRERKRYDREVFVLSIAAEIIPRTPTVWYNRAAAYARKGDRKRALADLRQAVDKGWKDGAALQKDDDFAALRQDPEYQRLLATLEPREAETHEDRIMTRSDAPPPAGRQHSGEPTQPAPTAGAVKPSRLAARRRRPRPRPLPRRRPRPSPTAASARSGSTGTRPTRITSPSSSPATAAGTWGSSTWRRSSPPRTPLVVGISVPALRQEAQRLQGELRLPGVRSRIA